MILLIYYMSKPLETAFKSLPLLLKADGKALKGGDETPRL